MWVLNYWWGIAFFNETSRFRLTVTVIRKRSMLRRISTSMTVNPMRPRVIVLYRIRVTNHHLEPRQVIRRKIYPTVEIIMKHFLWTMAVVLTIRRTTVDSLHRWSMEWPLHPFQYPINACRTINSSSSSSNNNNNNNRRSCSTNSSSNNLSSRKWHVSWDETSATFVLLSVIKANIKCSNSSSSNNSSRDLLITKWIPGWTTFQDMITRSFNLNRA